jgi:hypothetical protein
LFPSIQTSVGGVWSGYFTVKVSQKPVSVCSPAIMTEDETIRLILWFLNTPSGYLDGQKPKKLLGKDDDRLVSLIKAALHPADPF